MAQSLGCLNALYTLPPGRSVVHPTPWQISCTPYPLADQLYTLPHGRSVVLPTPWQISCTPDPLADQLYTLPHGYTMTDQLNQTFPPLFRFFDTKQNHGGHIMGAHRKNPGELPPLSCTSCTGGRYSHGLPGRCEWRPSAHSVSAPSGRPQ